MYFKNTWSFFYAILHHAIQGNSFGVLFNGLLAELPTILDSFFTGTTNDYIGVVGWGWWGSGGEKHMSSINTSIRTHGCCK